MLSEVFRAHRVLIVDDQAIPRNLESFALEGTGRYLTIEAGNASDALTELIGGGYDCAVIDLDMPDMTGLELITMIRRTNGFGSLPIVLVMPDDPDRVSGDVQPNSASRVLTKPFNPWDLTRVLDDLLGPIEESPHSLSVEAVLRGFPYPTMILDAHHSVVLANDVFYEKSLTGVGEGHIVCNDALHEGGEISPSCPLDECVRTGAAATRDVDSLLGPLRVSVYPLAARTGDDKQLYLHVTQPC